MPSTIHDEWCSKVFGVDPATSGQAVAPAAAPPSGQVNGEQPMTPDCKLKPGMVDGPKHHVLCATHGHVLDTERRVVIAASVADYDAMFPVPRPKEADCKPVKGKMPNAPVNIMLCGTHGHVLDVTTKQIVANTPSMFGRKQAGGGHAPTPTPALPPLPPPDPPPPQPGPPPQQPAPLPPDPPNPNPVDPSPITHIVHEKELQSLAAALDQVEPEVAAAMASDSAMRADMVRRKIDLNDMNALSSRLAKAVSEVDAAAVKTLRNARANVNECADGLQDTAIEIDAAQAHLNDLVLLLDISDSDDTAEGKKAKAIADLYDTAVNVEKALVAMVTSPLPVGLFSGLLEIAGGDQVKSAVEDHMKQLMTKNQELNKHLDEAITKLQDFGRAEMTREGERLAKLTSLQANRIQHYNTAVNTFTADFASLRTPQGAKPSPEAQEILDCYKAVDADARKMASVKTLIQGTTALRDTDLLGVLQPIGTFDRELTEAQARSETDGRLALVYVQDSHHVNLFRIPRGTSRADLEGLSGRVQGLNLKLFDAAASDIAAVSEKWKSAIDAGFSM